MGMERKECHMQSDCTLETKGADKMVGDNHSPPGRNQPMQVEREDSISGGVGSLCMENEKQGQDTPKSSEKPSMLQARAGETGMTKSVSYGNHKKLSSPISDNARKTPSSHTNPSPFSLETEKRALNGSKPVRIHSASANADRSPSSSCSQTPPIVPKKTQPISPTVPRKSLLPECGKAPDDEDACSIASTTASIRSSRTRSYVPSAPTFRSSERAEKRKEFYAKLEEKHQALEAERNQSEAKAKEAEDACLKELRKSMTFKANPVPSFYYEGPPPKVELKKVPPTRAKSPKFSRRRSCDVASSTQFHSENNAASVRVNRHSTGSFKSTGGSLENEKYHSNTRTSVKDRSGSKVPENVKPVPLTVSGQRNIDASAGPIVKDVAVHS